MLKNIYLHNTLTHCLHRQVKGEYVTLLGETFYKISAYDAMPPFFMTIVSDSDHWLFISSTGGLTAGRINAESALFPYYTEDRLTEDSENTGGKTILLVEKNGKTLLWEPFSSKFSGVYHIQRNLYKNVYGDKLVFEEINHDLKLSFKYAWRTSDAYGFVRTAWLKNDHDAACSVEILDGLQNILPYGANTAIQTDRSNLLDAYKRNELDQSSGLGMFSLSSTLTDLAEPSESLKTTTVWQAGLEAGQYLLSARQMERFRHGFEIREETDVRGVRGAFLVNARVTLSAGTEQEWHVVADVNQDPTNVAALINPLTQSRAELSSQLWADIEQGTANLLASMASADGLQVSEDTLSTAHHFSNVLFNTMRGGIFADNYNVSKADLVDFIAIRNIAVLKTHNEFFMSLPNEIIMNDLLQRAVETGSVDLERLCYEYLPLTFSRRHGDPSRPWNRFSINLKKEDGTKKLDYEGNWRDIFQNWEPLAYSYPEFLESMICKFLNATTADGYNPYRITRAGIEWEVPEPENPWANIGYWSDHQIIYLEKLLEVSEQFYPGRLESLLNRRVFSHANVPYKIKAYEQLLKDWYDTIEFDVQQNREIEKLVQQKGTDAKLILDRSGKVFHITFTEKVLLLLLAKLSNFVPEGGIWLNTQRPEWNDGNNALVGKGMSVVTTCYLRRCIAFCLELFKVTEAVNLSISKELYTFFEAVKGTLEKHQSRLQSFFNDAERRAILDALGQAGSEYRKKYYQEGFSGDFGIIRREAVIVFLETALAYIEHTIRVNKREDGLYHTYNILQPGEQTASVNYLYEMLEGQVAVLSSGMLSAQETLELLNALRVSKMYREDQHSYILYPDRDLPGFLAKNCLSAEQIKDSELIAKLVKNNHIGLIVRDENGVYHFNGTFRNAKDVKTVLDELKQQKEYADLVKTESANILTLFEKVFDHQSFTGRSGTFFAYEGLGSIYWHMVSKLLLAVQENYFQAVEQNEETAIITQLAEKYYDIRQGIGFNKAPDVYGAFPTDPYSHTPAGQGAKQPGMTGQVKEEVLTRLGEMGLCVRAGEIVFNPVLLRKQEFLTQEHVFRYIDISGQQQEITLPAGSLVYTFCQVPVIYCCSSSRQIEVLFADGTKTEIAGNCLDRELSRSIFQRTGKIHHILVSICL